MKNDGNDEDKFNDNHDKWQSDKVKLTNQQQWQQVPNWQFAGSSNSSNVQQECSIPAAHSRSCDNGTAHSVDHGNRIVHSVGYKNGIVHSEGGNNGIVQQWQWQWHQQLSRDFTTTQGSNSCFAQTSIIAAIPWKTVNMLKRWLTSNVKAGRQCPWQQLLTSGNVNSAASSTEKWYNSASSDCDSGKWWWQTSQ